MLQQLQLKTTAQTAANASLCRAISYPLAREYFDSFHMTSILPLINQLIGARVIRSCGVAVLMLLLPFAGRAQTTSTAGPLLTPTQFLGYQLGSQFTYATGKLVLWSADANLVDAKGDILKRGQFRKIAYATPKLAPYGAAAEQVVDKLGLTSALAPKLVQGESIGQTFNFVQTGNAELGFVAMSQVLEGGKLKNGSMWVIPQTLYAPIQQDAVVLKRAANNDAAQALVKLLKSPNIKDLIRSYGYDI